MRDVKRIDVMIDRIREIWKKYPDLRFMQLIVNCLGNELSYYLEDDELLYMINKTYPRGETNITLGFEPSIAGLNPAGGATNPALELDPSDPADRLVIADLLSLISVRVSDEDIADWTKEMAAKVEIWAVAKISEANGYTVKIPTRPAVLP